MFKFRGRTYRIAKDGLYRWHPVQGDTDNEYRVISWRDLRDEIILRAIQLLFVALLVFLMYKKYSACMELFDNFWFCALSK